MDIQQVEARLKCMELAVAMFVALKKDGGSGTKQDTMMTANDFWDWVNGAAPRLDPKAPTTAEQPSVVAEALAPKPEVVEARKARRSKTVETAKDPLPEMSFDTVRDVTLKLRDSVSKEAVQEVLKIYGVEKITELGKDQYQGYVESCKDRLPADGDDLGL